MSFPEVRVRKKHFRHLLTGIVGGAVVASLLAFTPAEPTPRLIGAVPVSGTPNALGIMLSTSNFYYTCTAAPLKSRVLLTAAHCVLVDDLGAVVSPGAISLTPLGGTLRVSGAGLVGASPVRVIQVVVPAGFTFPDDRVPANDIALLVLDSDIGASPYTRLATRVEVERWVREQRAVDAIGYGLTAVGGAVSEVPRQAQLPLAAFDPAYKGSTGWMIFSSAATGVNICSGDSGGPRFTTEQGATLLVAETAGGACSTITGLTGAAFVPITYLDIVNPALAAAGFQTIPSSPLEIKAAQVANSTTLWWSAPAVSPETAASYQVLDSTGAVLCSSAVTSCTFPSASITSAINVRSMNGEGEGDAALAPVADVLRPVAPAARAIKKRVRIFVTAVDFPAVTSYVVRDRTGKKICTIAPTAAPLACTVKAKPGSYRFRVEVVTPNGTTPASRLSRAVKVRG
jgi:hypothetical protein